MKTLILGAGGIGGYFGARLIQAGADVTFLVREARQQLIERAGLQIETPDGQFSVQPHTVTAATVQADYDLIVLAPKAYDLDDALASLARADARGAILPFLNGLDHLRVLDARYGRARVLGGVAHIAATITPTGAVKQLSALHRLTVGARDPAHEALARDFFALCQQAAFDSAYSEDIEQVLWNKWVFLATLAGMTTVCQGTVGEILATPEGEALTRQMFAECCAVAAAQGQAISVEEQGKALAMLTQKGSAFTASMLRDLHGGQRTEHEHILGDMVRRGGSAGVKVDLLRLAWTHMAVRAAQR
ncbi:MAG: 2-dehydropantoate 2-reductase [Hylemonella sp.]|uniref:2-dehydropantoate 2-reductase n=1 Tax=Hylemonella sp. TaxID=2066020 RepID=UPI0022C239F7|nr:2-dehydropantoate 2-reductase [Hylemonella sp.]MCZ8250922.1 2-dehydropantoate 2-reductase [Hylemonella sp.]